MADATDTRRLAPEVRAVAIVVIVGAIMSILDTTIINVGLDTLSRDLHAPLSQIQWVSTAYLLALATVIPLTGWAAERFGAKRTWMASVAAFIAASVLCGLAWSADSLIAFRVLQGLAGGMIMPIGIITLAQAAGPRNMGRVMSVVGVPMLLAPVFGPLLGGVIVEHLSWSWLFYVNVPFGLLGLVLAQRRMADDRATGHHEHAGRLDVPGLLLLSPGVALVVYGLSEIAATGQILVWRALGTLAAGMLLTTLFALRSWRHDFPVVDVRLLRGSGFAAATITMALAGAALFGGMILLPLYYQVDRGLSAIDVGLLLAPQGIGAAAAMRWSGALTDRYGGGPVVTAGLLVLLVGTVPFALVTGSTPYWWLALALLVRGVGLGFTLMPTMASAYALLDHHEVPRATPMLNVLQRIGGAIGVAVLAVILQREIDAAFGGAGGEAAAQAMSAAQRAVMSDRVADAFGTAYWWSMAMVAAALIPALVMWRQQRRTRGAAEFGPTLPADAEIDTVDVDAPDAEPVSG
ncbi:MAG: MDR family MFS transporter [Gaiellales bacterium]